MENLETIIKTREKELIIKIEELTKKTAPQYRELIIGTLLDEIFAINKIDKETEEVISKIKDLFSYVKITDISKPQDVIPVYSKKFREIEEKFGLRHSDFSISYYLDLKHSIKNCVVATSLILQLAKETKNKKFGAIVIPSHAFSVYKFENNYYPLDGNSFQIYSEEPFEEINNLKISYSKLMEEKREKLKRTNLDKYLYNLNLEDEISLLLYGKSVDEFLQFILPTNSLVESRLKYDINESISFMVNLGEVVALLDKDRGNLFINDPALFTEDFKVKDSIRKNTSKLLQKLGTSKPNSFIVYNKEGYIKGDLTQLNFNTGKLKANINNTEFTLPFNNSI